MTTKDEVLRTVEALKMALKLALEALEETRNALAWFYDSYPQDVTKKGNELLPHVETVLTAIRAALASKSEALMSVPDGVQLRSDEEQPAQQDIPDLIAGALGVSRGTAYDMMREALAEAQQQEPVAGLRCKIIENCKSCQHSVGRLSCSLAGRDFNSLERSSVPPEWCPLPLYTSPQPAQQQEPVARYFEQWQGQPIEEIDEERFNQIPEECRFKLYTSPPAAHNIKENT